MRDVLDIISLMLCFILQEVDFTPVNQGGGGSSGGPDGQTPENLEGKLRQIGDSIVIKLVDWIRRLPFYSKLSVNIHTHLLTEKFHELVVITTTVSLLSY